MNLTIPKCLAAAIVCGAALLSGEAEGATKKVLLLRGNPGAAITTGKKIIPTDGGSYTVALWLKADASKSKARGDDVVFRQQTDRGEVSLMYDALNHKYGAQRYSSYSGAGATEKVWVDAPEGVAWHYVAVIYDKTAKTLSLSVDGVTTTTENCSNVIKPTSDNFTMANYIQNAGDRFLGGAMAEMSVWNSALSAEKLAELRWARPSGDKLTGCLAYWPFDENNSGATARDISSSDFAATLPTKTSGNAPIYNLSTVDDFPEGFNEGDTSVYFAVDIVCPTSEVQVVVSDAKMKNGKYLKDSTATFTASAKKEGLVFDRWYGNVPDDIAANESITLTIDDGKRIAPYYKGTTWNYESGKFSDGYWTLNASLSAGEVTASSIADYVAMPEIDLAKPIKDSNGDDCVFVAFSSDVFRGNVTLCSVKFPETLRSVGGWENQYNRCGCFSGCTALTNAVPFLPSAITYLAPHAFSGDTALAGELTLGGGAVDLDCRPSPSWGRGSQFYNTAITSLRLLNGFRTIAPSMFGECSKLTSVEVAKGSVTNILDSAFANCKKVTSFTLPERPEIVDATAFDGWTSNQCRFVVRASDPGWAAYMAEATNFVAWEALDAATREGYKAKFPGTKHPLGLSLSLPKNQWLCADRVPGLTIVVE